MKTFKSLGLTGDSLKGVLEAGYESPTQIQEKAIPIALDGKDLIGCAQTGTGKTAAFVLPTIQFLAGGERLRNPRALVVAPTRELAIQVDTAFHDYGKFTGLKSLAVFGGVSIHKQQQVLRRGVDVVVATPGRLLDLMDRRSVSLSDIEVLILDEADRMFDMGFIRDIKKIVSKTPENRQTLLFSATMPKAIQELTRSIQYKPSFVVFGSRTNPADSVSQRVCRIEQTSKMDLLCHILSTEETENVIVFSRTKHRADRITRQLDRMGFAATAMHSNKSQNQRQRALDGFRRGKYDVLVATDIAARGIDVDGISHVINYDAPGNPEDYIHRIGRTGRANEIGSGITFVTRDDEEGLTEI
jgi:ATP-dependent RNA helicase RhlE